MNELQKIIYDLIEEGIAARAHFQTWWALRNLALPKYYKVMNDYGYVDFFHASNSGHYKLIFIALSKIYDRDPRTSGLRSLKAALAEAGCSDLESYVDTNLALHENLVARVSKIRSQSIAHNQKDLPRTKVYKINGVTPNQIRLLIEDTCKVINHVGRELGLNNLIFDSDRGERAVLNLLETLEKGRTSEQVGYRLNQRSAR
jgi:hypothetical protein